MYYNIGMEDSLRVSEKGNESLNIYLRYFLFHDFKRRLSLKDNEALLRFIQRLSFDVKKLFYPFELSLIAHYPRVAILYINLTKVRWRLRRYPTWGDKCDLNKINPQYLIGKQMTYIETVLWRSLRKIYGQDDWISESAS